MHALTALAVCHLLPPPPFFLKKKTENKETLVFAPLLIGGTVGALISLYSPLTQMSINPARDFGPRLVAWLYGWGSVAIPGPRDGFWVYIVGPMAGKLPWSMSPLDWTGLESLFLDRTQVLSLALPCTIPFCPMGFIAPPWAFRTAMTAGWFGDRAMPHRQSRLSERCRERSLALASQAQPSDRELE